MEKNNKIRKRVKCASHAEDLGYLIDCHDVSSSNEEEETSTYSYTDYSRVLPDLLQGNQGIKIGSNSDYHAASKLTTKLNEMLSDPELSDIITWLPHGRSFLILQRKTFARKVLPRYYGHNNLESFLRLVNAWGFRRVNAGPDRGSFYHELFLRGMPHLHDKMKRMTSKEKKISSNADENCPNFYEMAYLPSLKECVDGPKSKAISDFQGETKVDSKVKSPGITEGSCSIEAKKTRRKKTNGRTKGFVIEGCRDFVSGVDGVYAKSISFADQKEQGGSHHQRKRHKHSHGNISPGLMAMTQSRNVSEKSSSDAYHDGDEQREANSVTTSLQHCHEETPPQNKNPVPPKERTSNGFLPTFESFSTGGSQAMPAPLRWNTDDISCVTGPSSQQSKSSSQIPSSIPPRVNQHQDHATPLYAAYPMSQSVESVVSMTSDLLSMPLNSILPSAASSSNFKMIDMITALLFSSKAEWTDYRGSEPIQVGAQLLRVARDKHQQSNA